MATPAALYVRQCCCRMLRVVPWCAVAGCRVLRGVACRCMVYCAVAGCRAGHALSHDRWCSCVPVCVFSTAVAASAGVSTVRPASAPAFASPVSAGPGKAAPMAAAGAGKAAPAAGAGPYPGFSGLTYEQQLVALESAMPPVGGTTRDRVLLVYLLPFLLRRLLSPCCRLVTGSFCLVAVLAKGSCLSFRFYDRRTQRVTWCSRRRGTATWCDVESTSFWRCQAGHR